MDIKFQGTMAVLNDTHNPFQDQRALREVELFLAELQPDLVVYAGDLNDLTTYKKTLTLPLICSRGKGLYCLILE